MTKLSIVIVSYNVRYFLKQCLQSVLASKTSCNLEILVVDNNSQDGSVEMIRTDFPTVKLIANDINLGFSKANNQGFNQATGDYILILNPDTIIEENTIETCLEFYKGHPDAGAVGVRMVDGSGSYLPESKRGFPTPLRSLFKLSGLASIFPQSALFNGYYLGHLQSDQVHEVEVLSGAFVFTDKETIQAIGGFDEDYFMYGEDIELSYQVKQLGKKIYYLPDTTIIHFKGESTTKGSFNYLRRFYGAMQIYANKRHEGSSWVWKWVLNAGILLAGLSGLFKNIFNLLLWPIINLLVIMAFTVGVQKMWAVFYFKDASYYDSADTELSILILSSIMVLCYYILGHFDKKYRLKQWIYAAVLSALVLLAIYGLFPTYLRFSRTVLLILIVCAPFLMYTLRLIYNRIKFNSWRGFNVVKRRLLIIGHEGSGSALARLITHNFGEGHDIFTLDVATQNKRGALPDIVQHWVKSRNINELIFCSGDVATEDIFAIIAKLDSSIDFRIASNDNQSILGSSSRNKLGEWYTFDIDFKIDQEFHRRTKRLIDLLGCFFALILFPIGIFLFNRKVYTSLIPVLLAQKTWVSYKKQDHSKDNLPLLKKGVFEFKNDPSRLASEDANLYYARNYSIWLELEQVFLNFTNR